MERAWRIDLLGGLRATLGDLTVSRFRTRKTGLLLAYLAYYPQRAHPRDELVELLWPEQDLDAGRVSLRQALASLRRQLEPAHVPPGAVLIADRAFVRLDPAAVSTDVAAFEEALGDAARTGGPSEDRRRLAAAIDVYRAELLPGYHEEWILRERERLAEAFFRALERLTALLEQAGDLPGAVQYARRAVSADPLREESHRHLIRLLAASDQFEAALRQYHELERLLERELGVAPEWETMALVQSAPGRIHHGDTEHTEESTQRNTATGSVSSSPCSPCLRGELPSELPQRVTLTFLLTDIERSTALWEQTRDRFGAALESHHALLRDLFRRHGGFEVKEMGDAFLVAFPRAEDALACAVAGQRALALHPWPEDVGPLRVRMALHTGEVERHGGTYRGLVLHHAQRIVTAGHGGQILCSAASAALLGSVPAPPFGAAAGEAVELVSLGRYRLRDVAIPQELFQAVYPDLPQRQFPPLRAHPGHESNLPVQFTRFFGREEEIARLCQMLQGEETPLSRKRETSENAKERLLDEHTFAFSPPSRFRDESFVSPTRLFTLTGPGGTGKTRLGIEVATRLQPAFDRAVWFVPLADLSPAPSSPSLTPADEEREMERLIADRVREALGRPRSPGVEPLDQVVEALSHQPSLLVLDNMEQIASEAALVTALLLERLPRLSVMATSRRRLQVTSEREFPVRPLPAPEQAPGSTLQAPGSTLSVEKAASFEPGALLRYPSIQLFTDRAQAVRPDFQVTPGNAAAVAALCERLEGIPLAIELMAARANVLAPAQMLAQLSERFEALVSPRRTTTERHRSLRAAIDWSYDLLTPPLQRRFASLSVFRGGWTVEAAADVCLEDEESATGQSAASASHRTPSTRPGVRRSAILDHLSQLRAHSLVVAEEVEGEMRFRMLETVREYAAEQLAGEERRLVSLRHLRYFSSLAERAEPELQGPDQTLWLGRLEGEHPNLRAALDHAITAGDDAEPSEAWLPGIQLAGALVRFWMLHGHLIAGRRQLGAFLALPDAPERAAARGKVCSGAGILAHLQGDFDAARGHHEASLAIRRALGDRHGVASSLNNLGCAAERQGDYPAARAFHEESLAIRRDLGDAIGISYSLNNLGNVAYGQGDYPESRRFHQESLALKQELGEQWGIAASLENLASVAWSEGDHAQARSLHEESLAIRREVGDQSGIASSLANLGGLRAAQNDHAAAQALYEESLAIRRDLGDRHGIAACLCQMGNLAGARGDREAAMTLLRESLAIRREINDLEGIGYSLAGLGVQVQAGGDMEGARALFEESLTVRRAVGDRSGAAASLRDFGTLAAAQGDLSTARERFEESLRLRREIGDRIGITECLEGLAAVVAHEGDYPRAAQLFGAAAAMRGALQVPLASGDQPAHDRVLATLRARLGETVFADAWEAGERLTRDEAVSLALAERSPS